MDLAHLRAVTQPENKSWFNFFISLRNYLRVRFPVSCNNWSRCAGRTGIRVSPGTRRRSRDKLAAVRNDRLGRHQAGERKWNQLGGGRHNVAMTCPQSANLTDATTDLAWHDSTDWNWPDLLLFVEHWFWSELSTKLYFKIKSLCN